MNKNTRTGSHLFFIEFFIVLSFFLIVSTVCLRLFAASHTISTDASLRCRSLILQSSVAALLQAGADTPEKLCCHFQGSIIKENTVKLQFNKELEPVQNGEEAALCLIVTFHCEEMYAILSLHSSSFDNDMTASWYRPMTRKEALQ